MIWIFHIFWIFFLNFIFTLIIMFKFIFISFNFLFYVKKKS